MNQQPLPGQGPAAMRRGSSVAYQEVRHLEVKEFLILNQDAGRLATKNVMMVFHAKAATKGQVVI
jgi:hypothetical protein